MSLAKFERLCNTSKRIGESNDCMVKAMAIAGRMTYNEAHLIAQKAGRKKREGTNWLSAVYLMKQQGYAIEYIIPLQPNGSKYTPKTIGKRYPKGYYICITSNHAFALHNGEVCDWTNGRKHRIIEVVKVVKTRK